MTYNQTYFYLYIDDTDDRGVYEITPETDTHISRTYSEKYLKVRFANFIYEDMFFQ